MESIVVCPAKINLFLNIIGKRQDGFHDLVLINQTVDITDTLIIKESNDNKIVLTCDKDDIPLDERNSIYQITKVFLDTISADQGFSIHLNKTIPTMAGLGGESTDAAGMLLFLDDYFKTNLPFEELIKLSLKVGSDIPYFLKGGYALVKGRGEEIIPLSHNPFNSYIIVVPNFGYQTKEMFERYRSLGFYEEKALQLFYNDFEKVADDRFCDMKNTLYPLGLEHIAMTGSGSSLVVGFHSQIELEPIYQQVKKYYPNSIDCNNFDNIKIKKKF